MPCLSSTPYRKPLDLNEGTTTAREFQDDFNYVEDTTALYGLASYTGENWKLIGGLRFEDVSTESTAPGEVLTDPFLTRSGGYDKVLPSAVFSYDLTEDWRLKVGASQSVGRPNPGDVARRERRNDVDLTISRGNPDLEPRESTNFRHWRRVSSFPMAKAFSRRRSSTRTLPMKSSQARRRRRSTASSMTSPSRRTRVAHK